MKLNYFIPILITLLIGFNTALASSHLVSDHATIIDANTAKAMHERGSLFIDVRSATSYSLGHIPGAVNIDVRSKDFAADFTKTVRKDQEVVIYCRGNHCDRSPEAILIISPLGYGKLFYFKEGTPGWTAAGYDLEK